MKKVIFPIIFFLLCSNILSGCKDEEQETAQEYLTVTRDYYVNGDHIRALARVDSISVLFPTSYAQVRAAKLLSDSIVRTINENRIDSINNSINVYKAQIYTSIDTAYCRTLRNKIDSLELAKTPFRLVVNEINNNELRRAASCQCRTSMQNNRR